MLDSLSEPESRCDPGFEDRVVATIESYRHIARQYADTWFNDPVMEPLMDRFCDSLESESDVLDAGCGPGRDLAALARRGMHPTGVDLCQEMVEEAHKRVPGSNVRLMDFRKLVYPPAVFDAVWCCACLHHLPLNDTRVALDQFARVLRPGGTLALSVAEGNGSFVDELNRFRRLQRRDELLALLDAHGFTARFVNTTHSSKGTLESSDCRRWIQCIATLDRGPEDQPDRFSSQCHFCPEQLFRSNKSIGLPGASGIIWGNDDLFVVPDIAPLARGHVLIVAREHSLCLGACDPGVIRSVETAKEELRRLISSAYGAQPIFFEHGPANPGKAGACIAHPHLHCLPGSPDIARNLEQAFGKPTRVDLRGLRRLHAKAQSYLFVEQVTGTGLAFEVDIVPTQLLRRLVSERLHITNWHWQLRCHHSNTKQAFFDTISDLVAQVDRATRVLTG